VVVGSLAAPHPDVDACHALISSYSNAGRGEGLEREKEQEWGMEKKMHHTWVVAVVVILPRVALRVPCFLPLLPFLRFLLPYSQGLPSVPLALSVRSRHPRVLVVPNRNW
jgi:hypothetical protein